MSVPTDKAAASSTGEPAGTNVQPAAEAEIGNLLRRLATAKVEGQPTDALVAQLSNQLRPAKATGCLLEPVLDAGPLRALGFRRMGPSDFGGAESPSAAHAIMLR